MKKITDVTEIEVGKVYEYHSERYGGHVYDMYVINTTDTHWEVFEHDISTGETSRFTYDIFVMQTDYLVECNKTWPKHILLELIK